MTPARKVYELNSKQGKLNRQNGEAFEFRILRKYKKHSDVAFSIRSAGSHSAIDIIIQFKDKRQSWVTCKRDGYLTPQERKTIIKLLAVKPANVKIVLAYYKSVKKMVFRELTEYNILYKSFKQCGNY